MKIFYFILILVLSLSIFSIDVLGAEGEEKAVFIPVHGEIDRALVVFLRRSIEKVKTQNASHIIFDVDTFGGRVDSALQIATLIGSAKPAITVAPVRSISSKSTI